LVQLCSIPIIDLIQTPDLNVSWEHEKYLVHVNERRIVPNEKKMKCLNWL